MVAIALAFVLCLVPSLSLYFWVRSLQKDKPGYTDGCRKALINGLICTVPVVLVALALNIIGALLKLPEGNQVIWQAYRCFLLFAFAEEGCKFLLFKRTLKKTSCDVSWFDLVVFMTLVGIGFGMLESLIYSLTMSPGQAMVRGLLMAHGGYGFIMGYFFAKAVKENKKLYYVVSFLLPFLLHGFYDFALSPIFVDSDWSAIVAVNLALISLITVIVMIVFFARRKRNPEYTTPLGYKTASVSS